jgi:predicted acyltransferase
MAAAEVTPLPPAPAATPAASRRLISIDLFRGLLVMGMVLVTNAGSWSYVYWPLKHADWNGITPTDLIFPSFLFLSGVSMTYSFAARMRHGQSRGHLALHVVERCVVLILLGLFLNGFPLFDFANLRIPGVLQRIGLCYLIAGLLLLLSMRRVKSAEGVSSHLRPDMRLIAAAIPVLVIGYWLLMTQVPVPGYGAARLDMAGNLGAYIDRTLMHTNHLWLWGGQMWDPEGLLSTLPAAANMLLGVLMGALLRAPGLRTKKLLWSVTAGVVLMLVGLALNPVIPINKKIWTPSFMLFSGGFSVFALAVLHWFVDTGAELRGWRRLWTPALIFGSNAILAFTLAQMLNPLFGMIAIPSAGAGGKAVDLPGFCFQNLVHFLSPWNASLAYAVLFVLLNLLLLWPLYRRGIRVRL